MFELPYRTAIEIRGRDVLGFLQGLLTNDIFKIDFDSELGYGFMLTPQGKIVADCFVIAHNGGFMLDIPKDALEFLLEKMRLYKVGRKVEIFSLDKEGYRIFLSKSIGLKDLRAPGVMRVILQNNAVENNEELFNEYRHSTLQNAMPEFGLCTALQKFYPIVFDFSEKIGGVSYDKGCYVGQEVTARNKYRNNARKRAYYLPDLAKDAKYMDEILVEGEVIGHIIDIHKGEGIGLLEVDKVASNSSITGKLIQMP